MTAAVLPFALPTAPLFRERLERICGPGGRTLCVAMLNPSKAGPRPTDSNDPTITTLIKIARRLEFGRLVAVNLSTRIATDPREFFAWFAGLTFTERFRHADAAIKIMIREARAAELTVAAWGKWALPEDGYPSAARRELEAAGIALHTFGLNGDGTPRHPMARGKHRLPADVVPMRWLP